MWRGEWVGWDERGRDVFVYKFYGSGGRLQKVVQTGREQCESSRGHDDEQPSLIELGNK